LCQEPAEDDVLLTYKSCQPTAKRWATQQASDVTLSLSKGRREQDRLVFTVMAQQ